MRMASPISSTTVRPSRTTGNRTPTGTARAMRLPPPTRAGMSVRPPPISGAAPTPGSSLPTGPPAGRWGQPARRAPSARRASAPMASAARPPNAAGPAARATWRVPPERAATSPSTESPAPAAARPSRPAPAGRPDGATVWARASTSPSGTAVRARHVHERRRNRPLGLHARGVCQPGPSRDCSGRFGCKGSSCATSCTTYDECNGSSYCVNGDCVPRRAAGSACEDPHECATNYCADGHCCLSPACAPGAYCGGPGGICINKIYSGNAVTCTASHECQSDFCVDGVCCKSDCTDTCRRCDDPAMIGRCVPMNSGEDPNTATPVCIAAPLPGRYVPVVMARRFATKHHEEYRAIVARMRDQSLRST